MVIFCVVVSKYTLVVYRSIKAVSVDKEINFIGRVNNIIYFLTKITKNNS